MNKDNEQKQMKDLPEWLQKLWQISPMLARQAESDYTSLKEQLRIGAVSVSLLERAASLVGNPGTNISGSTDIACDEWQKDYERWRNER